MRILELTNYSAGLDGVFVRVKSEAELLAEKGHEVRIFSSNLIKGKEGYAPEEDKIGKVNIRRFPATHLGGESYMSWRFEDVKKRIREFKPDIIISHSYRHTHTLVGLEMAKELGIKSFLVTHAPFGDENRKLIAKIYVKWFDSFVGRRKLKQFDKIITITKWEEPYLEKLGIGKDKIKYIPNGIPEEFFTQKKAKENRKILFLGRIAPIKSIETLIRAIPLIKDKKIKVEIVGPAEEEYLKVLTDLINDFGLKERIEINPPVYELAEKIRKIDSAEIFVLPSKREAMPQALIEVMAREKIVIASNNLGAKDLIQHGKNGYLFKIGDAEDLARKIDEALTTNPKNMKIEAKKSVEKFRWNKIVKEIEKLL